MPAPCRGGSEPALLPPSHRSHLREGLPAGERRLPGQEEDQGGEEDLRPVLPAGPALRGEPPGQSPAGDVLGQPQGRAHTPSVPIPTPDPKGGPTNAISAPQVIVWGDYGRMDHKCFMGMAQIVLEELDLSSVVTGWYKLFPTSSLADSSIGPLARRLSQSSLESSTSPSCP